MNETLPTFNGINGATGSYLLPPLSPHELATIAKGETLDEEHLLDLAARNRLSSKKRSLKEGINPKDLGESGWGVIFAYEDRENLDAVKEALGELLTHRKQQAGERYKDFISVDAYRPGETKTGFLSRHGAGPGPVDPSVVPYYLLLVGDPQVIPYSFQYQLDVQYAVGRLHFDSAAEYAQYAHSVVEAETTQAGRSPEAVFFGVQNPGDQATQLSAEHLIKPLAEQMVPTLEAAGGGIRTILDQAATKAALGRLLGGEETPNLLFTASHGMGFPRDDPRQLPHQGALLCQDWPGPAAWTGPIPEDHYFSADDLGSDARLHGLLAFFFACYGAGTPRMDDFAHQAFQAPAAIAPHPFVAQLPRQLLGHPSGGALAVIGHVERAWGYSFVWDQTVSQLAVFESALKRLLTGHPVGSAMEYFNQRYAELSTILSEELRGIQFGKIVDDLALAGMWTANNDARSYVILGDPAVRLPAAGREVEAADEPREARPTLSPPVEVLETTSGTERISSEVTAASFEPDAEVLAKVDPLADARKHLARGMAALAARLGDMLEAASDPDTTLRVSTFISGDIARAENDLSSNTRLIALTRINLDGDTDQVLPENSDDFDEGIWDTHLDLVARAQAHRAEMIQAAASAAASLLEALKNE